MVVADEMEADFDRVQVVQALADERYGDQNTDGSHSVRDFFQPMRKVGATARLHAGGGGGQGLGRPAERVRGGPALRPPPGQRAPPGLRRARGARGGRARSRSGDPEAQDPRPSGATSARGASSWTSPTSSPGAPSSASTPARKACSTPRSSAARSVGGKPTAFDKEAALKVPGVRHVVELEAAGLSQGMKPLGGRGRGRRPHLGGAAGAQGAEGRVGPGARGRLRLGRVPEGAGGQGHPAGQGPCATAATWTRPWAPRPSESQRPLLHAAPHPQLHRASGRARASVRDGTARSGPAPRTPWAAARRWPRPSASRSRRSRSTSPSWAAASAASRSPISSSRRRFSPRRWAVRSR